MYAKNLPKVGRLNPKAVLRRWCGLIISLIAIVSSGMTVTPQKNCDGLIAALGRAQGEFNKARAQRIAAEGELNRARNRVSSIVTKIKANEAQQSKAEAVLDKLKEEQASCSTDSNLAPLTPNCATVQARIDRAKKDIAALRAVHQQLEDQRLAADMDVERNEQQLAAKRAAESAALTALEKAKQNAAGCRRAA